MSGNGARGFDFTRIQIFPGAQDPAAEPPAEPAIPKAQARPAGNDRGSVLDACARLHWDRGERIASYRACGYTGAAAGLALVLALGRAMGAPAAAIAVVALVVPVSFLLAVRLSRAIFGYERIVLFEKTVVSLGATAIALRALGHDVGAGLDLAILGIGTFIVFGRVGCLMVGCCHGRPSRWGIRYGVAHGRDGLPWYYVDRRLFPIQLVDGLASLVLVIIGSSAICAPHPAGAIAAGYLVAYGAVRWFEELFRGDAVRPRFLGLSEAQWTAALLAIAALVLAPRPPVALAGVSIVAAFALALGHRRLARTAWGLTSPWHLDELHRILLRLERAPAIGEARTLSTSHGLCVSLRRIAGPPALRDYVFSFVDRPLPPRLARALARHVRFARTPAEHVEVRLGTTPGIMHVLAWVEADRVEAGRSALPERP